MQQPVSGPAARGSTVLHDAARLLTNLLPVTGREPRRPRHPARTQKTRMDLQLRVEPHGERAVVHVAGEIDLATCPQLRAALLELTSRGVHHLLVDLAQVSFLDSSGIGVLIGALHRVRQHQGSITLVAPTPRVRQVLGLTGITQVLPVHASLNQALVPDPT
jgi:anti-sigma B factor antagonist